MGKHNNDETGLLGAVIVVLAILLVLAGVIFMLIWNPQGIPKG
jgi:hypothetical protein